MRKEDREYQEQFGHIPNTQIDRIKYILGKKIDNEKFNKMIKLEANKIKRIKWKKLDFIMWKIPKPAARPRMNNSMGYARIYVPGAAREGDWFEEFAKEKNLPHINTPCIINAKIYEKTPSSFNIKNKVLSELNIIRPWKRTGDVDNFQKTLLDQFQHYILSDDALVIDSHMELCYSIKPRVEVEIKYMETFPKY